MAVWAGARFQRRPKAAFNRRRCTLMKVSIDRKPNLPDREKKPRTGRPGVTRALAEHPDRIIEAILTACPHCAHALGPADQPDIHAYDHIDLPPISPFVTRINRDRGVRPGCRYGGQLGHGAVRQMCVGRGVTAGGPAGSIRPSPVYIESQRSWYSSHWIRMSSPNAGRLPSSRFAPR